MPQSDHRAQRSSVTFFCRPCKWTWDGEPARLEEDPSFEAHPWRYFTACPICHEERTTAPWFRSLLKAWQSATGPNTPEGKAASARNLEGHPTPEEALRTRFNRMKHGLYARVATYFPAKPDGYSFCSGCEVERDWCREQPACVKKTETFLLHQAAFEQKRPDRLSSLYAGLHSALYLVLEQILQTIVADGVKLTAPKFFIDKDGGVQLVEYADPQSGQMRPIMEVTSHPLFKPLGELISRAGLSLSDMGMTQRVVDLQPEDDMGHLPSRSEVPVDAYAERQMRALEDLAALVKRANDKTERDPILIEHLAQNGEGASA